jgi:glycosyltransferase involved in cell wall biosynthesis
VADELAGWIATQPPLRQAPLKIGFFHLGADIDASAPSFGLPPNAQQVFDAVTARPSFLMVGTVEPRKGHTQALAAFELLWEQGADINLVIVGKQGWMMEKLVERMASHPEKDTRLFWLPGVSDEMLLKLYASSAALLAPSEGEGFGLPLIEAAQHHIPIIARNLPVFREVAGEHAYYFDGKEPAALAATVADWLVLHREGKAPPSDGMPWLTWSDSARQVLAAIEHQQWYKELPGD